MHKMCGWRLEKMFFFLRPFFSIEFLFLVSSTFPFLSILTLLPFTFVFLLLSSTPLFPLWPSPCTFFIFFPLLVFFSDVPCTLLLCPSSHLLLSPTHNPCTARKRSYLILFLVPLVTSLYYHPRENMARPESLKAKHVLCVGVSLRRWAAFKSVGRPAPLFAPAQRHRTGKPTMTLVNFYTDWDLGARNFFSRAFLNFPKFSSCS